PSSSVSGLTGACRPSRAVWSVQAARPNSSSRARRLSRLDMAAILPGGRAWPCLTIYVARDPGQGGGLPENPLARRSRRPDNACGSRMPPLARRSAMRTRACAVLVLLLCAPIASAQEGYLVPGDNLILEGVPKIPLSLVEKVARYTDFRAAAFADWHPTKQEMLILTRFADTAQVHHVAMPGGARTQLTFEKDNVGGASYEPRTRHFFV